MFWAVVIFPIMKSFKSSSLKPLTRFQLSLSHKYCCGESLSDSFKKSLRLEKDELLWAGFFPPLWHIMKC